MSKVFISSVVSGMEEFRKIAKEAIKTMGHTPVMCESLPARPYSPETVCKNEVEQSEIYVVILGKDYGYQTPAGISVTQTEFRVAKSANKSILAFVQQVNDRDNLQQDFLKEVEDYQSGVFRARFSTAIELNNEIIQALRKIEIKSQSITESDFKSCLINVLEKRQIRRGDPELILAFLPQPEILVDIASVEQNMGQQFASLCEAGVTQLCNGYDLLEDSQWTGFTSGTHSVYFCTDGLIMLITNPTKPNDWRWENYFAPPNKIAITAKGFRQIIRSNSGFVYMGLHYMGNTYVADPPYGKSETSIRSSSDDKAEYSSLFIPLIEEQYDDWIDYCVKQMKRRFKYS